MQYFFFCYIKNDCFVVFLPLNIYIIRYYYREREMTHAYKSQSLGIREANKNMFAQGKH